MDGQYWKGDRTISTNEWLLASDFWQFLEPWQWHGRWYEYEIFVASCTGNIYDLENERWLLGYMIDHVGIYGSRVAEGLSAFNVGLVYSYFYIYIWYCITLLWCTMLLPYFVRKDEIKMFNQINQSVFHDTIHLCIICFLIATKMIIFCPINNFSSKRHTTYIWWYGTSTWTYR